MSLLGDDVYADDAAYPDEEFVALLHHASDLLGTEPRDLERDFGVFAALATFSTLFPGYYADSRDTRTFLLGVEEQIHQVVRRTIPDARPPQLNVTPLGADGVVVAYTSARGLCALLEGLVIGVAHYYGEEFDLSHASCMHRGDAACSLVVLRRAANPS